MLAQETAVAMAEEAMVVTEKKDSFASICAARCKLASRVGVFSLCELLFKEEPAF